ncbi:sulfonate ABC transporter substrate-binding protein [Paenibacillus sp. FSL H7-0326]|uniref:ABC transporter substrate-binding protein n=1 Tax=Paenibacillus sp. FSL H7-0326 TaxID=1921144 RepID=UPI00096FA799|nr:aliphatic sulfonate ABC transporter substrate-binding protein [Paenibacillus sp. FSL H7-0326]OMC67160.1 sulfonate ABC transporter substrate-binding protein [Paenibacillus sp. FSL H7-0326]
MLKIAQKLRLPIFLLLALVVMVTGCGSASEDLQSQASEEGELVKVRIAINGNLNPLVLAQEKGWLEGEFEKLGAEVEWSKFTSGPPVLEALVSGRVDLSFLGDGASITGLSNELPFEVVGLIGEGKNLNAVLVPVESDIKTILDLKGKTIGLAKGSTSHVYLIKVLKENGLSQEDITIINLQPEDARASFEAGQLDAWVTIDPNITLYVEQKKAIALEANTEVYAPISMIAHSDFANQHPDLVIEYLKQFKRSLDWQSENMDEAANIYSQQTKIPSDIIKLVLERSSAQLSVYSEEALNAQQATSEILLENHFLKKPLLFKDGVNDSYVLQALQQSSN